MNVEPIANSDDAFLHVLADIEGTLTASHIAAFPVVCAAPDEDVAALREGMCRRDFTHMPVRDGNGRVTGVLHQGLLGRASGRAGDHVVALDRSQVVPARLTLRETVMRLKAADYLLVESTESGHAS